MAKKNKKVDEEKILGEEMETVTEVIVPTDEEKILGATDEIKTVKVVDYASLKRRYNVKNIVKNRIFVLNGYEIGAILGVDNNARKALKEGAMSVVVQNSKGEAAYKIEVIK